MNLQRLKEALSHARQSPFYRHRDPTAEHWNHVAITTKDDLRAAYPFGLLAVAPSQIATYHESSGTSGRPIASYFTEADWDDVASRFLRNDVGLNADDMVMVKTPYALVTTAHQMHLAARMAKAAVVPADNRSGNMPYARVIRLLRDLPITVAWCLPTEVQIWACIAEKMGLSPARDFPRLRAFLVAGESLSPARKRQLSRTWGGKRIVEDFGSTETGSLAGECREGRLHVWDDRLLFEVRNDRGIHERGAGSLVVTTLNRKAMPLVRYDLEDEVRISQTPCACGSRHAVIEITGRRGAALRMDRAREIYARDIEDLVYGDFLDHQSPTLFWRARKRGAGLEIEIAGVDEAAFIRNRLQDGLHLPITVKKVGLEAFLPPSLWAAEAQMQKPRFLFEEHEDWTKAIVYA